MVNSCLLERENQRSERALALHFSGLHGRDFALYIESTAPIRTLDRHLLDIFCTNIAICGENVGLVERLRTAAFVDKLTGLPNRAAQIEVIDELAKVPGAGDHVLALIDIDEFSETIDAFGYNFGDQQLQAVGGRLRALLPDDVHVARVGSDLFGIYGSGQVVTSGNLRKILLEPFDNEGVSHTISFSLGLVHAADADCSGVDLLRNAAIALKRAKVDGPGNEAYYTAEVGILTRQRVHMLHDLRAALENHQLIVAFQPQFDLVSSRVLGVEALLRWRNGAGQYVPLEQFISVAEQSGLIVEIGAWVLNAALAAQRELAGQGFNLRMAVNVSPVQFRHPGFLDVVSTAIKDSGIDPALLELEITESVALSGWKLVVEHLQAIKALGVSIAIDDFGTGFSSLSYLARLPADCLKIDRSFVHALDDRRSGTPIAAMVIRLGEQLGMRVLAEGVEDALQLQTLIGLGCREAQGLVYAPAMEQQDLLVWLRGRER
jgi:diguanylate cyclase (GGDEF)-like protein